MSIETNHTFVDRAAGAADHVTEQALGSAQRGVAAARDGSHKLLDRAQQASDRTVTYIKGEPVKAMLMAAAAGAALTALLALLTRPNGHH
jgi:ElaB/YqjD/DUF883 family membrane-anchored ribosome-binding protein